MPAQIYEKRGSGYNTEYTGDLKETTEKLNKYLSMMGGSATYMGDMSLGSVVIRVMDVDEVKEDNSVPRERHFTVSNSHGKLMINENGEYGLRIQIQRPDGDVPISILFEAGRVLRTSTRKCTAEIRMEVFY